MPTHCLRPVLDGAVSNAVDFLQAEIHRLEANDRKGREWPNRWPMTMSEDTALRQAEIGDERSVAARIEGCSLLE